MRSKMMLTTLVVFAMVLDRLQHGCAAPVRDLVRAGNAITNAAEK